MKEPEHTHPAESGQGDASPDKPMQQSPSSPVDLPNPSNSQPKSPASPADLSGSDSDDEGKCDLQQLYTDNPVWNDVTPVPLVTGSVMPIAYSDTFRTVFGYFRAVMESGEYSQRALKLCEHAAKLNAANYAVWMYRRKTLEHLKTDWKLEMQYISKVIERNPKNYQVWYHRQKVVEALKDPSDEFDFTAKILDKDAKNYHVWQHRQFVLRHFDILDHEELEFTEGLLSYDPFNNSAWMHRFFVLDELPRSCGRKSLLETEVLASEIRFTLNQISEQIHNESPWSYLRGLLRDQWQPNYAMIRDFCENLYDRNVRSPFLLAFMVDMFEEDISQGHQARTTEEKLALLKRVETICKDLSEKYDIIRKRYWIWIAQKMRAKYAPLTEDPAPDGL